MGEAPEQGYAERLMRIIQEEDVALHDFADFHEADHSMGHCLHDVYQHKRMHAALGDLTPAACENARVAAESNGCLCAVRTAVNWSKLLGSLQAIEILGGGFTHRAACNPGGGCWRCPLQEDFSGGAATAISTAERLRRCPSAMRGSHRLWVTGGSPGAGKGAGQQFEKPYGRRAREP